MKEDRSMKFAGKLLFISWFILCIAAFIYFPGRVSFVHWTILPSLPAFSAKLGRIEPIGYAIDLLRAVAGIGVFSFACISLGLFIIKPLKIEAVAGNSATLARLAYAATALLVGHGIFSLIFLTLAARCKLTPIYTGVILLIGLLSGLGILKNTVTVPLGNENPGEPTASKRDKTIAWLLTSIISLSLLYSSTRLSYDSVAVYFSDAKLTAMTNRVQYFTNDSFVVSIFQTAIQYTALIQVFGDQTARLFSWISGLVIIIFNLALGEKVGLAKPARLILLTLLLTSTAFLDLMGDGKVDLTSSAPTIAAVYWMVVEYQNNTPRKSILLLVGFLAGLAMVARPFNIFLMGVFVILFYFQKAFFNGENRSLNSKRFIASLFWVGLGAIELGIYHLFANWMILSDPLAMLSNASRVDPTKWQWTFDPQQILAVRLLYPLVVTYLNTPQSLGNISPLFIAFLPVIFIHEIRQKTSLSRLTKGLLIISIITLLLWIFLFFTIIEIRYVFFLWIILFIPLAEIGAKILENKDRFFGNILFATIAGLLIFIALRIIYIALDSYSPIDKAGNPQCFDSRFCVFLTSINENAPIGDRVLTLSAFRYYLRSDLFACSTTHDEYAILQKLSHTGNDAFWSEVYRQGYSFIAYENDYTTRHLQFGIIPSPGNTPEWIRLEPMYGKAGDLHIAYRIHTINPPLDVEITCEKNLSNIWGVGPISP